MRARHEEWGQGFGGRIRPRKSCTSAHQLRIVASSCKPSLTLVFLPDSLVTLFTVVFISRFLFNVCRG